MPHRRAIAAFACPSAAASTIRARCTSRCGHRAARARRRSTRRSESVNTTRYGLAIAIAVPSGRRRATASSRRLAPRMRRVPKIPDSTKNSLHWRLATRARERWPDLAEVRMRYRAGFAYVDGIPARRPGAPALPLALRRLGHPLGLRHLPRQPRRLRRQRPAHRLTHRHRRGGPRLRLRPLPQRPHRLDARPPTFQRRAALAPGPVATQTGSDTRTAGAPECHEGGGLPPDHLR